MPVVPPGPTRSALQAMLANLGGDGDLPDFISEASPDSANAKESDEVDAGMHPTPPHHPHPPPPPWFVTACICSLGWCPCHSVWWLVAFSVLLPCYPEPVYRQESRFEVCWWPSGYSICPGGGGLLVGCLTSQQHASVSQGWTCSGNFTCCHTEIEITDQTFYLT